MTFIELECIRQKLGLTKKDFCLALRRDPTMYSKWTNKVPEAVAKDAADLAETYIGGPSQFVKKSFVHWPFVDMLVGQSLDIVITGRRKRLTNALGEHEARTGKKFVREWNQTGCKVTRIT